MKGLAVLVFLSMISCGLVFAPLAATPCKEENFQAQCIEFIGMLCVNGFVMEVGGCGEGANLSGINLSGQNLSGFILKNAILTDADLSFADLTGVDLTDANLTSTSLTETDLTDANLTSADLTGANLRATDLSGADLSGAVGQPLHAAQAIYSSTICPNGVNSDNAGDTCVGQGF